MENDYGDEFLVSYSDFSTVYGALAAMARQDPEGRYNLRVFDQVRGRYIDPISEAIAAFDEAGLRAIVGLRTRPERVNWLKEGF